MIENDNSTRSPTEGGPQSDFRPPELRGLSDFPILRICETALRGNLFSESPPPMGYILAKTTMLRGRRLLAGFSPIFAHYNYEGESLSNFTAIRTIITSDESHLGQNDNFVQAPTVGGFLSDFRPLQLLGLFAFPILRLYGTFAKTIF